MKEPRVAMKRSKEAVIDLTEGSSFEDEPEIKKKKEGVKETKEKETTESIDLTKDDEEEASSSKVGMERGSWWCEACQVKSMNERNHMEHMEGSKHAKRLGKWLCKVAEEKDRAAKEEDKTAKDREKAPGSNEKVAKQMNGENKALEKWKCSLCGDTRASKGLLEEHYQKRHMQRMPRPRGQGPGPPGATASPEPPPLGPWAAGAPRLPQLGGPNMDLPSPDVFSHPSPAFRQRLCPDPALFRPVAAMLARPVNLQFATQGAGRWTKLTEDMVNLFNSRQQRMDTMEQKIALWTEIYRAVRTDMDAGIFVFGSTFNGFGAEGCDIDMCLFPQGPAVSDKQWLTRVRSLLQQHCGHFIKGRIELISAKVPILKFYDRAGGLEVDLSVNNPTSIRNTHLLFCYSQADYRVRPLVLAVKLWAKEHGINEARFQTLSSYSLTLMVLHYLQSGVFPPVLPCLQEELPQVFHSNSTITSLPYEPPPWSSRNRQCLGELFCGFFSYYGSAPRGPFDPRTDVASVRRGQVLDQRECEEFARARKLNPGQWSARILLEEPFDRTNAARAVCSDQKWEVILEALLSTREVAEHGGHHLGLEAFRPRRPPRRF